MKLLTRDTDYAVRALVRISRSKNQIVSVTELVKDLKTPRPFLRKILQQLNRNGILVSYKGQGGGFSLARPSHKISVVDLIGVFQGPLEITECLFRKKICPERSTCALRREIGRIEEFAIKQLKDVTIMSLSNGGSRWPRAR
ncbi:MAG TPA: Rrf2 family transcriptional regulator [Patescibacteria group bacterium]|nr:Rrf2 family transcriptional regulator [Patescibacteria group bacterium]